MFNCYQKLIKYNKYDLEFNNFKAIIKKLIIDSFNMHKGLLDESKFFPLSYPRVHDYIKKDKKYKDKYINLKEKLDNLKNDYKIIISKLSTQIKLSISKLFNKRVIEYVLIDELIIDIFLNEMQNNTKYISYMDKLYGKPTKYDENIISKFNDKYDLKLKNSHDLYKTLKDGIDHVITDSMKKSIEKKIEYPLSFPDIVKKIKQMQKNNK